MGQAIELISKKFQGHADLEILPDQDLKKLSTMRLESRGDLVLIKSEKALQEFLCFTHQEKIDLRILGWGANQLLEEQVPSVVAKLEIPFDQSYLDSTHDIYELPASVTLSKLSSHAVKFGMIGWEVFTGIPATLGGAVYMNAGTNLGEISSLIDSIVYYTAKGERIEKKCSEKDFSYRTNNFLNPGDFIYSVKMKNLGQKKEISDQIKDYLAKRNKSQPLSEFTCGCTFKNSGETCRAGHYLDIIGMKGFSSKNFRVSHKHANFIENFGEGTYTEVSQLMEFLQQELKLQYGVQFEFEVKR